MKSLSIMLVMAALLMGACEKSEYQTEGDFFHLSHKGAKMPIWVKGNFFSDVMIITVHGGPGDSGMAHAIETGFQYLEDEYLMVYYDQRYAGMTQGNPDPKTVNPDQYIEDLEKVVQLIKSKYPGKKLFMIGHSWGGQLSAGYLGRDNHFEDFKGWIDLDGSLYGALEVQMMKDYILERVPEKMAEPGADQEYWQFIIDFYEENPVETIGNYTAMEPYWYASACGGDVYDRDKYFEEFKIPYTQLIFKSMFTLSYYMEEYSDDEIHGQWDDLNYTPEIGNITIPALMLWGADDGIVPAEMADYVHEHLGTDPSMKSVVKIPECSHGPQVEQPGIFYAEVSAFVETYKNL